MINQTPTQDKSSPYNLRTEYEGLDKSSPYSRNFWLAITYYFKDIKKYCIICRGQALSGVRPYPLECYIGKCAGEDLFSVARPDPVLAKVGKYLSPVARPDPRDV